MCANVRTHVSVGEGFSQESEMKVGVQQGSVLSPLPFIIVLEALSHEFRAGVPLENLYADDLVIIANSLVECVRRLLIWKIVSEFDQEIPQSQTADNPLASRGRAAQPSRDTRKTN